ncbi:MAG: DUF2341 domain-containing protein, partial [Candidatus Woesearchaeota archaeon]
FTSADVTIKAKGTEVHKCNDWNFSTQTCHGEWILLRDDLIPGQEYNITITPDDPGFIEYINVSSAELLSPSREFIEDVNDAVLELDNNTVIVPENHFIRVHFEEVLDKSNDITIYGNSSEGVSIEVYEKGTNYLVAEFTSVTDFGEHKEYLSGLIGKQDSFDMKVIGGNLEIDYIVDPSGWYDADWKRRKVLIINSSLVTDTFSDFPVLVSFNSSSELLTHAQPNGDDVLFTDSDGITKLSHEIEFFNSTSGEIIAWVKIPSLSDVSDKEIYLYYNNPSSSNQENISDVWSNDFVMVQHLQEESGSGNYLLDSTNFSNDGAPLGSTTPNFIQNSFIGSGYEFAGLNQERIEVPSSSSLEQSNSFTAQAWVKVNSFTSPDHNPIFWKGERLGWGESYMFRMALTTDSLFTWGVTCGSEGWFEGGSYSMDDWTKTTLSFDGTTARSYVDGVEVGSDTACSGQTLNTFPSEPVRSGFGYRETDTEETHLDGEVSSLKFSSVPRSAQWIETEYNNQEFSNNFVSISDLEVLYNLTILEPIGNGDFYLNGSLINSFPYSEEFISGENIDIEAVSDSGWSFKEWFVNGGFLSENSTETITINEDKELNTSFIKNEFEVQTNPISNSSLTSVDLEGELITLQGYTDVDVYFEWGTNQSNLSNKTPNIQISSLSEFNETISGLNRGETYYFRAVGEKNGNISFGQIKSFYIFDSPTADSLPVTNIVYDGARLQGEILDDGGLVSESIFRWRPKENIYLYDDFSEWNGWNAYSSGDVYHSSEQSYSGTNSLKKDDNDDPNGGYKLLNKSTGLGITLEAYVYRPDPSSGGSYDRFAISNSDFDGYGPRIGEGSVDIERRDGGVGTTISSSVSWSRPENQWYKVVFEMNQSNVFILTIYDLSDTELAKVTSNVDTTYTDFDRFVVHGGHEYFLDNVLIKGGIADNWTETNWKNSLYTNDDYSEDISGLLSETEYEFQTKARNSIGEGNWSDSEIFVTGDALVQPDVLTESATDIQPTQATLQGELIDMGNDYSVDVWFEWDNNDSFSNSSFTSIQSFNETASFEQIITGLSEGETYYYRAYVQNDLNTVIGDTSSFTALAYPSAVTNSVTNITNVSARLNGEVTYDGNDSVETKFRYRNSDDLIKQKSGSFLLNSLGTKNISGIGFEPDLIEFRITSTNEQFDRDSSYTGQEWGWGHGFAKIKGGIKEVALTVGSGSASTNGMAASSSNSYSIYQVITPDDGDGIVGWIESSLTSVHSDGFIINTDSLDQSQYVTFTAYKFEESAEIDVGAFNTPTVTGTDSVNVGFEPNFLKTIIQPHDGISNINDQIHDPDGDNGWGFGLAAETTEGIEQVSLAVSMHSENIDYHSYGSSDSDVLYALRMKPKDSTINGRIKASLSSFNSNGFTLDYSDVDSGQIALYLAIKTNSDPFVGYNFTPTSSMRQEINTSVRSGGVSLIGSNTIPSMNSESVVIGDHHGWMHGGGDSVDQRAMGFSSSSDSVNGHSSGSSLSDSFYLLYTDKDGIILGKDVAWIREITDEGFILDWSEVVDTSTTGVSYDSVVFGYYGFRAKENWMETSLQGPFNTGDNYSETITGLELGNGYEFQTKAKNSIREGYWSDSRFFYLVYEYFEEINYSVKLLNEENQSFSLKYVVEFNGSNDECYLDINYSNYLMIDEGNDTWSIEENYSEGIHNFTISCNSDVSNGVNYTSSFNVIDVDEGYFGFESLNYNEYNVLSNGLNVYINDSMDSFSGSYNTLHDFGDYSVFEELIDVDLLFSNFSHVFGLGLN